VKAGKFLAMGGMGEWVVDIMRQEKEAMKGEMRGKYIWRVRKHCGRKDPVLSEGGM